MEIFKPVVTDLLCRKDVIQRMIHPLKEFEII